MATIKLEDVEKPSELRDRILAEWRQIRLRHGNKPPENLFSTFHAADNSGVKSHDLHRGIDVVTGDWNTRIWLFELGLRLQAKHKDINVIFYPRGYEPHLHVATWSGFSNGSDNSLSLSLGVKGKYDVFKPSAFPARAYEFMGKLKKMAMTYPPIPGDEWPNWKFYENILKGNGSVDDDLSVTDGTEPTLVGSVMAIARKYWWVGAISVFLLIGVIIYKKMQGGENGRYAY